MRSLRGGERFGSRTLGYEVTRARLCRGGVSEYSSIRPQNPAEAGEHSLLFKTFADAASAVDRDKLEPKDFRESDFYTITAYSALGVHLRKPYV